jgi:hypothetical protein
LGRLGPFLYCTKVDAKLAELAPLTPKFGKQTVVLIFRKNAPDRVHWTQTHVLVPFGPFRYSTKVDAKLAELVPLTHKIAK